MYPKKTKLQMRMRIFAIIICFMLLSWNTCNAMPTEMLESSIKSENQNALLKNEALEKLKAIAEETLKLRDAEYCQQCLTSINYAYYCDFCKE